MGLHLHLPMCACGPSPSHFSLFSAPSLNPFTNTQNPYSPVCKAPLESVFVFDSPQDTRPFASLLIWGTEAGPGWVHDDRAQVRTSAPVWDRQKSGRGEGMDGQQGLLCLPTRCFVYGSVALPDPTAPHIITQLFMPRAFMEGVFKPIQAPGCPMPGCG